MTDKPLFLIPVENQVREFDAKLLLACCAARRGFASVLGPRRELEFRIPSFPRSIFISKDLRSGNGRLFRILSKLGHICVAWDEEALIHEAPEIFYRTRLARLSVQYASHLFAWGPENAELWRQYPELPSGTSIHITGNPRGDMLRPDLRTYFEEEIATLQNTYGDFILVNTNFSAVNNFTPVQNLFQPADRPGEAPKIGRAARGMSREFAEEYQDHTVAILEDFKGLIPVLEQTFPDHTIVVRPHPSESSQLYHDIAAQCRHVQVTNQGNVIPWLAASRALVHNGCTTAIEAYAMGIPAVAYRATVNEKIDSGLFSLPNRLSHQCFDLQALQLKLRKILAGDLGVEDSDESRKLFEHYFAAQDGPLASERITDILETVAENQTEWPTPSAGDRLKGRYGSARRRLKKQFKSYLPGATIPRDLQRHRYPGISVEAVRKDASRFCKVLGYSGEIKTKQISDQLFQISA